MFVGPEEWIEYKLVLEVVVTAIAFSDDVAITVMYCFEL
tara:strand:- start:361 stop:477 length:117 start_codon:yes stop_codon:yes gene_type:complete